MFEDLFIYPKVLARHRAGPPANARERFLAHCAAYGAARGTLLRFANELLVVAERIDVNSGKSFSLADVEAAAESWTRYQLRRGRAHGKRWPQALFIEVATAWLRFLGCLEERSSCTAYSLPNMWRSKLGSLRWKAPTERDAT